MIKRDKLIAGLKTARENDHFEIKKAEKNLPANIWETYSAFANTKGGFIVLGVEEGKNQAENRIIGVSDPEKMVSDFWGTITNKNKVSYNVLSSEDISIEEIEAGKRCILIEVPEAPWNNKPVYLDNNIAKSYKRLGDGDRLITADDLRIYYRNANPQMDDRLLDRYTIADLDMPSVVAFKELVTSRYPQMRYENKAPIDFLIAIGAMRKKRDSDLVCPTIGCLLFLGKINSIKEAIPSFHLDYFNRKGDNQRWIDRLASDEPNEFQINIFNFYQLVYQKLLAVFTNEFALNDQQVRTESAKVDDSIREAFVNMLAHADYDMNHSGVKIEVLSGCIRFVNPGVMLIPINDFFSGGTSKLRNNVIMSMFRLLGLSERQGMGGQQIIQSAIKNRHRIPELRSTLEETELRVWYVDLADSYPELSEEEKEIFQIIVRKFKPIRFNELQEASGKSEHKLRMILKSLLESGKIEKIGKGPAVTYTLGLRNAEMFTQMHMMISDLQKII